MPKILSKDELLDKAFKRANKVTVEIDPKRRIDSIREKEIQRIDKIASIITSYFEKVVEESPRINKLSPFYQEILGLMIDIPSYKKSMASLNWGAEMIKNLEHKYRRKLKGSSLHNLAPVRREYYGRVSSIIKQLSNNLDFLEECRIIMKKLPVIQDLPTIIIAGMPNVGKSTIFRNLTSAKVEIQPYPFTTKGIQIGLIDEQIQLIDTPGLLDRTISKMNKIERNTIIALNELSKRIIFLIDPSETCGYSIESQVKTLQEIESYFELERIDCVLTKTDLLDNKKEEIKEEEIKNLLKTINVTKFHKISEKDKESIEKLKREIKKSTPLNMKSFKNKS